MNYIREIRTLIGNRPFIMVGAAVLILNKKNHLLLQKRNDNGAWGPPGGAMEPGETLEEAARRETYEETGLELGELTLFGVFSGPEFYYRYPNGDQVHNVTAVYQTREFQGVFRESGSECGEIRFFPFDQLPENLSPPISPILKKFSPILELSS